jgi:hypothetical protein
MEFKCVKDSPKQVELSSIHSLKEGVLMISYAPYFVLLINKLKIIF